MRWASPRPWLSPGLASARSLRAQVVCGVGIVASLHIAESSRIRRGGRLTRGTFLRTTCRPHAHSSAFGQIIARNAETIPRRLSCSDFRVHVAVAHNRTEHPPKWHLQYVIAGVVVLEVPDSHPAPEGAVGLGSQKSKDERGPPHQDANGYHEDFLCLSTRYREPSSPSTRLTRSREN